MDKQMTCTVFNLCLTSPWLTISQLSSQNASVSQHPDVTAWLGSMRFLTSKVYLYITTVQSESLACKIGVLHIYNRYTIIYYHNKTKANKKNKNNFLNTLTFLQFSQHFFL